MPVEPALATDFAILILTATLLGFLARKTKQPTIIAYIATGLILGPVGLSLVTESELIEIMSELGLGLLLFLLGIEMNLEDIKEILKPVTNIAVWQTVLQTSLAFVIPLLLGFTLMETFVIALCTVFGATPVIVKLLTDKDEITTLPGKIDVGVLILQDIYLVIILALFSAGTLTDPIAIGSTLVNILVLMSIIAGLSFLSAKYILPGLFKRMAEDKHAFFIHGIAWAFMFISLSLYLDLSVEVGAFLAGLGLGQIPYREELKERIRPITDFFMVIFFSSIGLTLTVEHLLEYWLEAVLASAALMVGNFIIMFYLIDRQKFTPRTSFLGSINMTQVSEFSLVVGTLAVSQGFIEEPILGYLSLMALLTMSTSSYLINYNHEIYKKFKPYLEKFEDDSKEDVEIQDLQDHVILVGYDATFENLIRVLNQNFDQVLVVDKNQEKSKHLEHMDVEYIYGDFNHGEIRKTAGLKRASMVISGSNEFNVNRMIAEELDNDTAYFARAIDYEKAAELYDMGAHFVIIENMMAGEQLADHIKLYLEEPEIFRQEVKSELERLYFGSQNG